MGTAVALAFAFCAMLYLGTKAEKEREDGSHR